MMTRRARAPQLRVLLPPAFPLLPLPLLARRLLLAEPLLALTLELLATASSTIAELEQLGDALLGHFVDRCRRDGRSWSEISAALGVTKQAAHKRFSFSSPNLARMTDLARSTLEAALDGAQALREATVGTEHVLLGLFAEPSGLAARALGELGIDRDAVLARVEAADRPRARTAPNTLGFGPQAAKALEGALGEALRLGHNYVGTEHLLLALFRDGETRAARILADLGADGDALRARFVELVGAFAAPDGVT